MKIPLGTFGCFSLEAPTLTAHKVEVDGVTYFRVWCDHCQQWHYHGPRDGHREAHCRDPESPYWRTGCNLALGGEKAN